jgi:hypothetical protein
MRDNKKDVKKYLFLFGKMIINILFFLSAFLPFRIPKKLFFFPFLRLDYALRTIV